MTSSSDEGEENNGEKRNDEAQVGVVNSKGQKTYEDYSYDSLGQEDQLEF